MIYNLRHMAIINLQIVSLILWYDVFIVHEYVHARCVMYFNPFKWIWNQLITIIALFVLSW